MTSMRMLPFLVMFVLPGCPDPGPTGNPEVLWLDLDGSELRVRLVDSQPRPF